MHTQITIVNVFNQYYDKLRPPKYDEQGEGKYIQHLRAAHKRGMIERRRDCVYRRDYERLCFMIVLLFIKVRLIINITGKNV